MLASNPSLADRPEVVSASQLLSAESVDSLSLAPPPPPLLLLLLLLVLMMSLVD